MNARQHGLVGVDVIAIEALYPISFESSTATAVTTSSDIQDPAFATLMAYFQGKGLETLKREDRREGWYQDWIEYQARHGIYASLLSPARYSSRGQRLSICKLARFVETFSYFSPAHAYGLHVSLLGLLPILMSDNEPLKQEAIARLEAGGLFAFAVSEQTHGSDLFANEMTVRPGESAGTWRADGAKYYIGNAQAACIVSVFGKKSDPNSSAATKRAPFAFFAMRPAEAPAFQNVRKIRTLGVRTAFVGSFEVKDHAFADGDMISQGRSAWDAVRDTVNFGKFFLGFGAIGICEHALAEAVAHMGRRVLFDKPVLAMPHIRHALVFAFTRLLAMKLFAYRALDYLQVASAADRRYLLWGAVQKAKVSTEGVKVVALLSECIGARGFEADTYFESALRDIQMIPGLEGSTHINYGLTAQFLGPYFTKTDGTVNIPEPFTLQDVDLGENAYWIDGHDRNARNVRFADWHAAFAPLNTNANVRLFVEQVEAFQRFAGNTSASLRNTSSNLGEMGLSVALGKCLACIAYAQLIGEHSQAAQLEPALVSVLFHTVIEDFTAQTLAVAASFPAGSAERSQLQLATALPETSPADLESVAQFVLARYGIA